MKGLGTDDATLIRILCNRSYAEIEAIKVAYMGKYGKDLMAAVHSEISGDFLKAMTGVLKEPRQYDSDTLHEAMKGLGTNSDAMLAVLIGRNNQQLDRIKAIYSHDNKRTLEAAITSETSGDLRKLMLGLVQGRDPDWTPVNEDAAKADAERLYNAGEGRLGTDEKVFIEIFSKRSWPQIRRVFSVYETIHKHHTMEHAVHSEFSGHLKMGLSGIVMYARNPGEFYADLAHKAMLGVGTDETQLTRVLVGNRDRMAEIKAGYSAKYNRSLWQVVNSETSFNYKKTLLAVIGA